jgi:hypothetical protein
MTEKEKLALDLLCVIPVGPGFAVPLRAIVQKLNALHPDHKIPDDKCACVLPP